MSFVDYLVDDQLKRKKLKIRNGGPVNQREFCPWTIGSDKSITMSILDRCCTIDCYSERFTHEPIINCNAGHSAAF